jgi:hypothetical protein
VKKKDTKKMHPAVQRVKDMIVDRLVARRRFHKMDDSQRVNSEYLIQVFKQWDEGMSGFLTPDEFCNAIGERHLNLGVSQQDMKLVLDEVDADHNGEISYKEFAKFLQVHDIDPEYGAARTPLGARVLISNPASFSPSQVQPLLRQQAAGHEHAPQDRGEAVAVAEGNRRGRRGAGQKGEGDREGRHHEQDDAAQGEAGLRGQQRHGGDRQYVPGHQAAHGGG